MHPLLEKYNKQIAEARARQKALLEKADSEDRDLTDDEQTAFDADVEFVTATEARRAKLQGILDAEARESADNRTRNQGQHRRQGEAGFLPDGDDRDPHAGRIRPQGPVNEQDPTRGFSALGEFATSVYQAGLPGGMQDSRLPIGAITGHGQLSGPDGGFLVPPAFSTAIWDALNESPDNLLARTDSYPVTGDSLTFNANAETSRATGSRYGGIRAYWIAEGQQMTGSKVKFRQLKLEPQQLAVMATVTDKLLRNAPALDSYLMRAAVDEINFEVGNAIINGDGIGKPLGVLNSDALVGVTKETGQAAATIVTENIIKMFARCHARSRPSAVWFYNQDIEPQLMLLTIDVGTGGLPVFMPPGGLSAAPYGTILGRPAIPIEYAQALGTKGDIMLLDLGAYATGTAGGIDSAASIHLRFDYNETTFRFLFSVDGRPWLVSPITPFKGSTLSPFVALNTRS